MRRDEDFKDCQRDQGVSTGDQGLSTGEQGLIDILGDTDFDFEISLFFLISTSRFSVFFADSKFADFQTGPGLAWAGPGRAWAGLGPGQAGPGWARLPGWALGNSNG